MADHLPAGAARGRTPTAVIRAAIIALGLSVAACGSNPATPRPPGPSASALPSGSATASATPASASAAGSPSSSSPPEGAFDPRNVGVHLEPYVDGLDQPLAIVNAGDGSDRLFVAEQPGRIRVIQDDALVAQPMLDIRDRISSGGERGLLGMAFHPDFPNDPRVFVDYTDRDGNTVVSAFTLDPSNPNRLDPSSEAVILRQDQPFPNHNGGALAFTTDGDLLIAFGDGGSGGDPLGNGQKSTTFLGKILRIRVGAPGASPPYTIPPGNPFADGADGRKPEIWLTGLRNPWRLSVDRATGDVWIGDVGQSAWEEIDVQRADAQGGTNFGWNRMEGRHCFQPQQGCEDPALTLPVADYGHDEGCTVIGGYVDRGETESALTGGYLFGDYCSGHLWAIDPADSTPRDPVIVGESASGLSSFGEGEDGALYAANLSSGAILRVVADAR
jgi:glucose/arabinose dehydrogenase